MSVPPRDAMILALLMPDDASISEDDQARLAAQFRVSPHKITDMIERLAYELRNARSTLDTCQPTGAPRCPHCGGVLPP